jgi:hypothetical protein
MKIEQKNLFGEAEPEKFVSAQPKTTAYKNPPNITILGGLNSATLQAESVYMLRVLSNQYTRGFPSAIAKKKFLRVIKAEMMLKQGKLNPVLLLRDCLLNRNSGA